MKPCKLGDDADRNGTIAMPNNNHSGQDPKSQQFFLSRPGSVSGNAEFDQFLSPFPF